MIFLRWWLFFCLSILVATVSYYFGFFHGLYEKDATKLSFVIISVYVLSSMYVGKLTLDQRNQKNYTTGLNVSWFTSEALLSLGMIGTVAGFILMLGDSFDTIDTTNPESLKEALSSMALGMSTALYTTLVGLVLSQALKIQLVNLESGEDDA
ncbi:MotA/TolQ/ExbB proton channel family protein [bacterium]|nr:MotA/TolQ/ExbB proton channel family protein [bacterium]